MIKFLQKVVALYLVFVLSACISMNQYSISNVDKPLSFVSFVIIKAFPNGKDKITHFGRRILSQPFLYKYQSFVPASNSRVRYRAIVDIRGNSPPYTIDVRVYLEVKKHGIFVKQKYYRSLAKQLSKKIKKILNKGRERFNIVDDLKAL